jgi:hypothetical protein
MFVDGLNKTTKHIRMHGGQSEFRFEFEISKMQCLILEPRLNLRNSNAICAFVELCFVIFRAQ